MKIAMVRFTWKEESVSCHFLPLNVIFIHPLVDIPQTFDSWDILDLTADSYKVF